MSNIKKLRSTGEIAYTKTQNHSSFSFIGNHPYLQTRLEGKLKSRTTQTWSKESEAMKTTSTFALPQHDYEVRFGLEKLKWVWSKPSPTIYLLWGLGQVRQAAIISFNPLSRSWHYLILIILLATKVK